MWIDQMILGALVENASLALAHKYGEANLEREGIVSAVAAIW